MNGMLRAFEGLRDSYTWLWDFVIKPTAIFLAEAAILLLLAIVVVALLAGLIAAAGTVFR